MYILQRSLISAGAVEIGVAGIQLRDGVVIVLLGRREAQGWFLKLTLAGADVHLAAFPDFGRGSGEQLLKCGQRPIVLALLQQLHGSLIVLKRRCCARGGMAVGFLDRGRWSLFAAGRRGSGLLRHVYARSASSRTRD